MNDHLTDYFMDCVHIRTLAATIGYDITVEEACVIWEEHSEDCCAGWLFLEDDASIKNVIEKHMPIHHRVCPHCKKRLGRPKDE